ncbi:MAG: hypothetical protein ACTSVV_07585 [Promethearchaeota archaeon]
MTIYTISIITSTGYPYYNLNIKNLPQGIRLYLRFFDFSGRSEIPPKLNESQSFELNAGLISALFEFAKNMDKKIMTLEFKSRGSDDSNPKEDDSQTYRGDVLITTQTETYLLPDSVKQKVKLIYDIIISKKIPLEAAPPINPNEEQKIIDILTDTEARENVLNNQKELRILANEFFKAMGEYGLEGICITSFDLSPIIVFGEKYTYKDIEVILRNIGELPHIEPLEWKYRQSFIKGRQVWVYLINSGVGVTVDGLFEPYFYLLFATPDSYLGEFPAKVTSEFNLIL